MSLITWIGGRRGKSGFGMASTAEEVTAGLDLSGKNVLITGVNSGHILIIVVCINHAVDYFFEI